MTLPSLAPLLASLGPPPPRIISVDTDARRAAYTTRYREAARRIKALEAEWSPILATLRRELDDPRWALRPDLSGTVRSARALAHEVPRLWANAIYLEGKAMELEVMAEDPLSEETVIRDAVHAVGTVEAIEAQLDRLRQALLALVSERQAVSAGRRPQP